MKKGRDVFHRTIHVRGNCLSMHSYRHFTVVRIDDAVYNSCNCAEGCDGGFRDAHAPRAFRDLVTWLVSSEATPITVRRHIHAEMVRLLNL